MYHFFELQQWVIDRHKSLLLIWVNTRSKNWMRHGLGEWKKMILSIIVAAYLSLSGGMYPCPEVYSSSHTGKAEHSSCLFSESSK